MKTTFAQYIDSDRRSWAGLSSHFWLQLNFRKPWVAVLPKKRLTKPQPSQQNPRPRSLFDWGEVQGRQTGQTLEGSFSAVSTPPIARVGSFFRLLFTFFKFFEKDLQDPYILPYLVLRTWFTFAMLQSQTLRMFASFVCFFMFSSRFLPNFIGIAGIRRCLPEVSTFSREK